MEKSFETIELPKRGKAKVELWKFMGLTEMESLLRCFDDFEHSEFVKGATGTTAQHLAFSRLLAKHLALPSSLPTSQIIIDLYFYLTKFAISLNFTREQINVLLSIIQRTHSLAVRTAFGNLDETFEYLSDLLLVYSVHRPPFSVQLFTVKEITEIIEYLFNVYFKQFKFYKFVFAPGLRLDLRFKYTNQPDLEENNERDLLEDESLIVEENETISPEEKELRDFIKSYLGNQLDKIKAELNEENRSKSSATVDSKISKKRPKTGDASKSNNKNKK